MFIVNVLSQIGRQSKVELAQATKTFNNKEDEGKLGLAAPPPPQGLDSRMDGMRDGERLWMPALKMNIRFELK